MNKKIFGSLICLIIITSAASTIIGCSQKTVTSNMMILNGMEDIVSEDWVRRVNGSWDLTDRAYAITSDENGFIYHHYRKNVFKVLSRMTQWGDSVKNLFVFEPTSLWNLEFIK